MLNSIEHLNRALSKVLDKAYEINGCPRFFDVNKDQKLIEKGDYFLYLGDKGLETANYLRNLGYDIKIVSSSEY